MFDNKTILVTGGTGSFGKKFISRILNEFPKVKKIIIFSRDELKQYDMAILEPFKSNSSKLRFFIGDVRDSERMNRACEGVDIIIHAAALKQVPTAEYNPMECIKTNVFGTENIVNSALNCGVQKVVALSTDKAAAPINLYGATKLCSDKLITAANNMKGSRDLTFSVVRYGNVMGSRGSVIPFFMKSANDGVLPITDERMTRFNITLDQGVDMVFYAVDNSWGGEIFVPKIPSYKILDIATAIAPNSKKEIIGIRPGEKIHEEMITETDSLNTLDCGKYYVILPSLYEWSLEDFKRKFDAKAVPHGFKYSSDINDEWVSVDDMRQLIREEIDLNFEPAK